MFDFLLRLFGGPKPVNEPKEKTKAEMVVFSTAPASNKQNVSNSYFNTLSRLQEAILKKDYESAAPLIIKNLGQIPKWIEESHREYGTFDIQSIPALQQGGIILALVGDDEGLAKMRELVTSVPELSPWVIEIEKHYKSRVLFQAILKVISDHPNCHQSDVKELVGAEDGSLVANLIAYLEKAKKIIRIRNGHTYSLIVAGSPYVPIRPMRRPVKSHRSDSHAPQLRVIDLSSLRYVPLPRSPLQWESTHTEQGKAKDTKAKCGFEVCDAEWQITSTEKIPSAERPDPAFRILHPNDSGLVMVDDLGKAEGLEQFEAAGLRYDRNGNQVAKSGLLHNIYRLGVHPLGSGLIAMSKECIAHAYNDNFEPLFETTLTEAPEFVALRNRFNFSEEHIKNHIRCVAMSRLATRYLYTVVDEAWCVDLEGKGLWGCKLPLKEGWTRVSNPSNGYGTNVEIYKALGFMNLSFPFTPDKIKNRYHELAKQWHPDLNPNNPVAEEKMKLLNSAAELLSGVNATVLLNHKGARYEQILEKTEIERDGIKLKMSFSLQGGEAQAADWIYAACFAANTDSVYLASYSGRVILVDESGNGVRAYDIGSVPRRIVDTDDYLYLLTDTRLYLLRNDSLCALIDTYDGGDLVVAQTGFGLIEKKRFRWFNKDGNYLGSLLSKDPIRRVYSTSFGMVVETRQNRAVVQNVPSWWGRPED